MNPTTEPASDSHEALQLLLPWYLENTLDTAEQQQMEQHLQTCLLCRRELLAIDQLATAVRQPTALDVAADTSFAAIREKLAPPVQPIAYPATDTGGTRRLYLAWRKHLPAAIGPIGKPLALAAAITLAVLPLHLQERDNQPTVGYQTLSASRPNLAPGLKLHVVFAQNLPENRIKDMLAAIGGQLLGNPNSVGAYTVQLPPATPDASAALAFLRNSPDVLLAEPALDR
ncbi:MAG: zf-HC2 domain-containing protein [Methylovulum sp.]|nr:zf-HC2 domain-containing protein [Methylovulum sp.]